MEPIKKYFDFVFTCDYFSEMKVEHGRSGMIISNHLDPSWYQDLNNNYRPIIHPGIVYNKLHFLPGLDRETERFRVHTHGMCSLSEPRSIEWYKEHICGFCSVHGINK
nr:hypothetical protein [Crucivirus sp.]